jgi:helicase MOV-10
VPLTPIHPDTGIDVVVCFRPSSPRIGQYSANIELLFEDRGRGKHFVIIRQVTAIVGSRDDYQAIAPTAPYQPRPRRSYRRSAATTIIPGERPQDLVRHPYKTKLGQYRIPQVLIAALEVGPVEVGQVLTRLPPTYRLAESNPANYVMRLKTQLWIEEYKAT